MFVSKTSGIVLKVHNILADENSICNWDYSRIINNEKMYISYDDGEGDVGVYYIKNGMPHESVCHVMFNSDNYRAIRFRIVIHNNTEYIVIKFDCSNSGCDSYDLKH